MPELPEVETVRRSLLPHVIGRIIIGLRLTDFPGVLGGADPDSVSRLLNDRCIVDMRRRAKYLFIDLDGDASLMIHLRMTGSLTLVERHAPPLRHQRLALELNDGHDLRFADQRKFGRVVYMESDECAALEARIGPEPLEVEFTASVLSARLTRRTGTLKSVLLNQQVVGGIGNIYADEALFRARLHPLRTPNTLTADEVRRLHRAIRAVLQDGITYRGTSLSSYRDGMGQEGTNQHLLRVYGRGRTEEPCLRCGLRLSCIVIAGRSTHFCANCQSPDTP